MSQRRLIVAQPAALCRDGAGLLQVGVLRWNLPPMEDELEGSTFVAPPRPALTVVVKATYSFAECQSASDEMRLAEEPEGMALDVPSELAGAVAEIASPSDFVPLKPICDVLLHGHAHCEKPRARLEAGFTLGELSRDFLVESVLPSTRAPLLRAAIVPRDLESPPVPVGPSPTPGLRLDYPEGFDFEVYQRALPSQRLRGPEPGAKLTLRGLSARAQVLNLRLPRRGIAAWLDTTEEKGLPFRLHCDTIWIDTDRELVVLVHRGVRLIPSIDFDGVTQITLALTNDDGEAPELAQVQRELRHGAFEAAVELIDFEAEAQPPLAAEETAFAQYAVLQGATEPSISLETYALVSADLAEGRGPRGETLERHGFGEAGFLVEERGWLARMGEAAMAGDTRPAARYGELFVAAQDALARPGEGGESVEAYVALKLDMEDAADPMKVLSERKMSLADWMRMDRRWGRRARAERPVELEIERLTRAGRAAREDAGEG